MLAENIISRTKLAFVFNLHFPPFQTEQIIHEVIIQNKTIAIQVISKFSTKHRKSQNF